jgi:hypothetical protein
MATGPEKVTSTERPDQREKTEIHPPKRTRGHLTPDRGSDGAEHSYKQVVLQLQETALDWSRLGDKRNNLRCNNFDGLTTWEILHGRSRRIEGLYQYQCEWNRMSDWTRNELAQNC